MLYIKVTSSAYFPDHMNDLVYDWYDDSYRSEVKFKVMDLDLLCYCFEQLIFSRSYDEFGLYLV